MAIYGWVGRLGHGKTMRMVIAARKTARLRKAMLASNISIKVDDGQEFRLLPHDGFSKAFHALVVECYNRKVGLVCAVDEIDTIWDAKEWQRMSKADRFAIKQSRHLGIDILWTAQFVDQVEKSIRNITEEVTLMRAIPSPTLLRFESGRRPWLFVEQRFRPGAVRDLMAVKVDPDRRLGRRFVWYKRRWEGLYDTLGLILPDGVDMKMPPDTDVSGGWE